MAQANLAYYHMIPAINRVPTRKFPGEGGTRCHFAEAFPDQGMSPANKVRRLAEGSNARSLVATGAPKPHLVPLFTAAYPSLIVSSN